MVRRVDGEPIELAWHRRWPPELRLTAVKWNPPAQHPYRVSWEHANLRFWASHGPTDRDGVTVVVHGPALEAELDNPRHHFAVVTDELVRRGVAVKDAAFPIAAVHIGSCWWALARRIFSADRPADDKEVAVAVYQEMYRTLNYRLVAQATRDVVELVRGRGSPHHVYAATWKRTVDERIVQMVVEATRARSRFRDGDD